MGENSAIEWTTHTFNPWIGCAKVSPACDHCYADLGSRRLAAQHRLTLWGEGADRYVTSDEYWRKPLTWNRRAAALGIRSRVFCASFADVFEKHAAIDQHRARLWPLIEGTTHLDWLLLTKRPGNIVSMVPPAWLERWPSHVWAGTTAEDRAHVLERGELLRRVPAAVRFFSLEPLLEDLGDVDLTGISWVIAGGESGPHARPMHPAWARSIRDQCVAAGVAYFFKQHGDWLPVDQPWKKESPAPLAANERWMNSAGGHGFHGEDVWRMRRVGKKAAGRLLDGITHDDMPEVP